MIDPSAARPRRQVLLRTGGLVVWAAALVFFSVRGAVRNGNDFEAYHRSGAWFLAGRDLYAFDDLMPYRYLPGIAALFAPLAALTFPCARAVWSILTGMLAGVATWRLDRRVGPLRALAVPLAWLCLVQPLFQEFSHGQVDVLVLVLALAAFAAEDRGAEVVAGVLVAFAAALKAAPIVLALDFVLRRRWRPLVGVAVGSALLAVAPVFTYGIRGTVEEHVHFLHLNARDIAGRRGEPANQSLWAMSQQLGLGFAGGALASAALLAGAFTVKDEERRRSLVLAAVPLVSGYGWPQGFVLAAPLLSHLLSESAGPALAAGALAAGFSVLSYDVAGPRVETWVQAHRVLGCLLLGVFILGRARAGGARRTAEPVPCPLPPAPGARG